MATNISTVKVSDLEKRILSNKTIIAKYIEVADNFIQQQLTGTLNSRKGYVSIPTLQAFMDLTGNTYKAELIQLYRQIMSSQNGAQTVNVETMVAQGALFDSLCFVYDSQKNSYCLATANLGLLTDASIESDVTSLALKKNKKGLCKAYRIDIEYINSGDSFTYKAVNARDFDIDESKPDGSPDKRFYLVPYIVVVRYMKFIEMILMGNATLRVHQDLEGGEKVRFITMNRDVLAQFCDIPAAVQGVNARFFPLKGFFYAPVVGAPSTSSMVTNINIFNVTMIKNTKPEDFARFNVHTSKNPIKDTIGEALVVNRLMSIKEVDDGDFAYRINMFPYRQKFLAQDVDKIDRSAISKYLHSVTVTAVKKVYDIVGVTPDVDYISQILGSECKALSKIQIESIEDVIRDKIVRIVIQKKDCTLSSMICTNNPTILKKVYGEDYFGKYEGFSSRVYALLKQIEMGNREYEYLCKKYGFWSKIQKKGGRELLPDIFGINSPEKIKANLADIEGVNLKRSESSNDGSQNLLVRSLTSYINAENKPVEYYKYLDKSKIVSALVFG